jgi:hypothetical protein
MYFIENSGQGNPTYLSIFPISQKFGIENDATQALVTRQFLCFQSVENNNLLIKT